VAERLSISLCAHDLCREPGPACPPTT